MSKISRVSKVTAYLDGLHSAVNGGVPADVKHHCTEPTLVAEWHEGFSSLTDGSFVAETEAVFGGGS